MNTPAGRAPVVAGVDDSAQAVVAARLALEEATLRRVGLTLAHAFRIPMSDPPITADVRASFRAGAERMASRVQASLVIPADLMVERVVQPGAPAELLLGLGENACMLVIGHHRVRLGEWTVPGGVASKLAARSRCPVMVAPAPPVHDSEPAVPSVVVALDGETPARAPLALAFEEASMRRARLVVLHAEGRQPPTVLADDEFVNLHEVVAGWKADYPDIDVSVSVVPGQPDEVLIEASRDANLLVVGSPHRRRFGRWIRSVTRSVLERSHCPLVVTPSEISATATAPSKSASHRP